jgi:glutamate/aspartate transport system substrate-binding protein
MMDDALLAGERAKAKKPDNWEIVGTAQSKEAYGCMLRKDDAEFKKLIDDTIAQAQTSGEAEKWFDKWFKNPIPPKNLNMNFELSDDMTALFKSPNDRGGISCPLDCREAWTDYTLSGRSPLSAKNELLTNLRG